MNSHKESDADAAFIVRACNSHADLLAALHVAREALERARPLLAKTAHQFNHEYSAGKVIDDTLEIVRAATAQAEA